MRINKKTMLFEDIDRDTGNQMRTWCVNVVLRGQVIWPDPPWVAEWMRTFDYNENQRLSVISTVLPQRVLLSLMAEQSDLESYFEVDVVRPS